MNDRGFAPPALLQARGTITLIVVAVVLSLLRFKGSDLDFLLLEPDRAAAEPWRFATSTLFHGGVVHLVFNVYWIWRIGALVEAAFGTVLFAVLALITGAFAAAAEFALTGPAIGLSGIVYGLIGFLWAIDRFDPRYRGALNQELVRFFVIWFFIALGLSLAGIWPIANVAHGMGGVLGGLCGWILGRGPSLVRVGTLLGTLTVVIVMATVARPYVNLRGAGAREAFRAGTDALVAGDNEAALEQLQTAVAREPRLAGGWHNLGIAYNRLGRPEEAYDAHRRAVELAPEEELYSRALAEHERRQGLLAALEGRGQDAIAHFEAAVGLDPTSREAWYALVDELLRMDRVDLARSFFDLAVQRLSDAPSERARWQDLLDRLRGAEGARD